MKKIVVKIGSSVIAPKGALDEALISELVVDILEAEKNGFKVVLVTSGAIASGASKLGLKKKPGDMHSLMALASLGQIILMDAYSRAFSRRDRSCAQILLSWDDFDSRKRFLNARATIDKLFAMDVIPVINENDAVSDEEIKFGDNDRLSALVGDLVQAQTVIVLSDVAGLLDAQKNVVPVVGRIDEKIYGLVRKKSKALTSGGMFTKLEAARVCVSSGIQMVIASGQEKRAVSRIACGENLGTSFLAASGVKNARKRWIAFSKKVKGEIYIDDGAVQAVANKGKSLLAVGIAKVEGEFKKKDSVQVRDKDGRLIGCGIVNYSSDELISCGRKKLEKEVIHRDNFVRNI